MRNTAATLAIVALVVAACASGQAATSAPPQPTPSASPFALETQVLASLSQFWQGDTKAIVGLDPDQNRSAFQISYHTLSFYPIFGSDHDTALSSKVAVPEPGQLQLTLTEATPGCALGDVGTYTFSLSKSGRTLTVEAVTDACSVRAEALPGQWVEDQCAPDPLNACLGPLDAGMHSTAVFDPRLDSAGWTFNYGGLSYAVPAGWRNPGDERDGYELAPVDTYPDDGTYHSIIVFADPGAAALDCSPTLQPGIGRSVADLTAWMVGQKGLVVTPPNDVTINGRTGTTFEVRLAPTWKKTCPEMAGVPTAVALRIADPSKDGGGWDWRVSAPERWRVFLLDLGAGHVVAVIIDDSRNPSQFDQLVAQAMPIVQTFVFR